MMAERDGLPATSDPDDPTALYVRLMYHEWFFGPFKDEAAVTAAINQLDRTAVWWDYDCWTLHYGANPLPKDFVHGFGYEKEMRERIEAQRIPFEQRPQPEGAPGFVAK